MRTRFALVLLITLAACGCRRAKTQRDRRAPFVPTPEAGFFQHEDAGQKYIIYRPAAWSPDRKWPVIVFLHGASERGIDGIKPAQSGLGRVVWAQKGAFPFVVVFPQCPPARYWGLPDTDSRVLGALERALRDYAGDPTRVYLTGLSLGGYGAWFLGARFPEKWAALVPICGGVGPPGSDPRSREWPFPGVADRPGAVARAIGKTPVWAFHGDEDRRVPVEQSREVVAALRRAGGNVRYTEYAGVGHNAWDPAFAEPDLFPWLLRQRRQEPLPHDPPTPVDKGAPDVPRDPPPTPVEKGAPEGTTKGATHR